MESKNILLKKKEFILNNYLSEDELKSIQPTKFLFLIKDEIEALLRFYSKKEIHLMINTVFEKDLSLSLLYLFCSENIDSDSKSDSKSRAGVKDSKINSNAKNIVNNVDDLTNNTLDFISKNLPKKQI
ncbi:hypothetical protein [Aliarcobacter cryaerophilus]|uniref:Uncharacterized protein n=2 Tax=unclassified Arcobacter TaxID=2593671 RepID=A0AA96D7L3_9BACT|nr:hypothetical protein RJG52_07580 [Arcobacter sp. AZ-2023]WPD10403.1 hypothetical protein QUR77_03320 [Arcobacter sp. DSM 115954]WNL15233.1 hypothetical protein RJG51_03330 [Arcobacter sp. AZ-2023]WNL18885.1 hypothetical protein RJG53_09910 [Arcobacter sp. AZ-2023]WNL21024.1 hypothetical protein RJG56_09790 [Arcobacter sp. AZ-2023]